MNLLARLLLALAVAFSALPAEAGLKHRVVIPPSTNCTGQPVGIVNLGLCDVAVLKSTNGARTATTNVAVYPSPPAGFSYSSGTQNTDITLGSSVSGLNNSGHGGLYYSGSQTSTLTDFTITSNAGVTLAGQPLTTGQTSGGGTSGATNFDGEHGTVDGSGMDAGRTTMVQPHGLGVFKLGFVNLLHPARDHFVSADPGGTFIFDHVYTDAPCQNTTSDDHCEPFHALTGGTYTWTGVHMNAADGTDLGSNSGGFQLQTGQGSDPTNYTGGPLTGTITGSVFNYGCPLNQALLSLKAVFANVTVSFGGNAVCPGASSANHVIVTQADITVTGLTGTFANGDTLTATGGKSAPLLRSGGDPSTNLHLSGWGTGAHFAPSDVITSSSGGTATVTAVSYHSVTLNDLGGNLTFAGSAYTP